MYAATMRMGGGLLIAEAFLAAGARRFAMITGDPCCHHQPGSQCRGFVERLLEEGIKRSSDRGNRRRLDL